MKCPACLDQLTSIKEGAIELNVCTKSCGGIWFDKEELLSFDEETETVSDKILRPLRNKNVIVDHNKKRLCPRCVNSILQKKLYDAQRDFEIDECETCGGLWLDMAELNLVRENNKTQLEQKKSLEDYLAKHQVGNSSQEFPKNIQAVFRLLF